MNKLNLNKIKDFLLSKKKIIIFIFLILLALGFFVLRSKNAVVLNMVDVKYANLDRSVRATGQVISNTNLDLSFNKSGIVKSIKVVVGDKVAKGQILATLDQGQAFASLTQAKGTLLLAEAKYNKTLQGASNEEIALAEVSLKNAKTDLENIKSTQDILVSNAYQNLLNSSVTAYSTYTSDSQATPTISGTYLLAKEGEIKISLSQSGNGGYFNATGLVNYLGTSSATTPQPIGDSGLYILFPNNYSYQNNWVIPIPNKKASTYLVNYNAYKNALETKNSAVSTAQSLVDQKTAELNLKKAAARNVDLDIAQAEVLSAQGSLQSAQSAYEDTVIRAPAEGTITKVDIKYGELSETGKSVITLEDIKNLYIEALINEANIAYLKVGQTVNITFDAFGNDKKFTGVIAHVDPSAETNDGVVNYKIKVSLDAADDTIRPGMNANIDVMAGEITHVLSMPNAAVMKKDGKYFVNVVTNEKKKTYKEVEITTGFVGDNNLVEVLSGLKEGDKIAVIQN